MDYLWWGGLYLLVGYAVALIFALFFTKILVVKLSPVNGKFEINSNEPISSIELPWAHVIVVLTNADDEILFSSLKIVFSIRLGWLFLLSGLLWPIFLGVLVLEALGRIYGKPLSINESKDKDNLN